MVRRKSGPWGARSTVKRRKRSYLPALQRAGTRVSRAIRRQVNRIHRRVAPRSYRRRTWLARAKIARKFTTSVGNPRSRRRRLGWA
jgi:hypothetical protein